MAALSQGPPDVSANGFTIGSLCVPNAVVVAPMAGVSDLPFRELCLQLGAGLAVGEMLTADPKLRDSRKSRYRSRQGEERLRSIQIVGSEPKLLAEAARYNIDQGADIIDINMGCPAKKVCKKAAGSALLGDETLVARILEAVVEASSVPVTLKIRTGIAPDKRNGVAIARIAESAGVQMLAVHGRTRADRFLGSAEYDTIAEIVSALDIPVIANGDIDSVSKAQEVLAHTGASGIMIGRAAQGRPWLPGHIARVLAGEHVARPSAYEQCQWAHQHLRELHNFYDEYLGLRIARKHVGWFLDSVLAGDHAPPEFSKRRFNQFTHCDEQHQFLRALADYLPQCTHLELAA